MLADKVVQSSLRAAYGETLVELGHQNPNIVVLDADLSCSTQTQKFAKVFPERFFNIGIAEQDAMGVAAGLSTCGKIPFVSTFAMFATGRAWEQIRNSIAYPNFNVKIVATHGGVTVGEDGASHQALEDVSIMRSIPHMTVIVPADSLETREAIKFAASYKGPVYIRIARSSIPEIFIEGDYSFNFPKANILTEGMDVTIVSNGETVHETLKCAKMLATKGILAEIINVPVVKPLDEETIIKSAKKTGAVVTIENHSIIGGLGSAISECLSENCPILIKRIGVKDQFGQSGKDTQLMAEYGLIAEKFIEDVIELIKKK
ncbi:MAG: transketolase family protein [Candidatus Gastranaerophilales bacterium]|nr:transketolase family protein [Candidatus Gastranaerophilales bacterium]